MTTPARQALDRAMTEAQLQRAVIDLAHIHGWLVTHSRPARMADGSWRTPIQGDAGAPDLLLARGGVTLNVELKRHDGRTTAEQLLWALAIGPTYRLWRPYSWPEIEATLRGER